MHQHRRRDLRPPARRNPRPADQPASPSGLDLTGADVVIVGYFSAKQKDFALRMDAAAADLTARGARVVGRVVQRRGVSNGGVRRMPLPYSSRTLLSSGKTREVAALREESGADAVVFLNTLTEHQRRVLTETFGCPAVSLS
ncbi:hypothetical protein O3Q52_33415 [Streptomyces sp. ActVer]|uniref:HflX-like GTP-binding protein n=1 Tax=Streptomyces sp. ActVer TaxID=3014558 RepID=UPI0022B434D1|nr:hypothetical protein [Streptomyces sp. ActVer]MCZ4512973.1 hypothetical protein [Streptomyces sp. ActVer]